MTAQISELLILDGEQTAMAFCPELPKRHPRILSVDIDQNSITEEDSIFFSTACWRGYEGTWELKDDRFYLVALRGRFRLTEGPPVPADWFSGVLRVPRGELLEYVHMGFGSVYESEVHIKVKKGRVVARRIIDNRGKEHDAGKLGWKNLPGGENRFPGDDDF